MKGLWAMPLELIYGVNSRTPGSIHSVSGLLVLNTSVMSSVAFALRGCAKKINSKNP